MSAEVKCLLCEEHALNRPRWGPGPWQEEPDRVEFRHAGMPCILHRGSFGGWCGYVGLVPGHPYYGKSYHDVSAEVHGGLTYSEPCQGHVCHVPEPGEPDNLWWLGFDFGHGGDYSPPSAASLHRLGIDTTGDHYWTVDEARAETQRLAEQLAAV